MYKFNDIVECNERYGRVMYYDPMTYTVHVLFKTNDNTWKIEKCDRFFCNPAQVFLWTLESVFHMQRQMRVQTPDFAPMAIEDDFVMHII